MFLPHGFSGALSQGVLIPEGSSCTFQEYPGFTAYPYSRAGVAIPRGMPICLGKSGVKQSKCERDSRYSPRLPPGNRVV